MQVQKQYDWQIIGAGAIGCLWAVNLIRSGQKVQLITRKSSLATTITYQNLQGLTKDYPCSLSNHLQYSNAPILVCVKATQVKQALLDQKQQINSKQVIILMHNGMGTAEQVANLFPDNPIICATTSNACLVKSPFNIQQTGLGITYLGAFNEPAKSCDHLLKDLDNALGNCHWNENVEQTLWLKLLINIAINPLTAIHQIKNGELAEDSFQAQINTMLDEALPVLQAIGLLSEDASTENNVFERSNLLNTVNGVIHATSENFSSMNRDIYHQRLTENEFINGYLLKKASQHNIETPLIKKLYQQIVALENNLVTQLNTK
ncbi:ketopantoate reductase family protein [Psychromonas sp. KJ10-10]|uniref:ketopantoate reductase family protein n=1 Tax=Psychromonas sp. KJ10-10 TaxID=3391823 RepID=UPI0039B6CD4D